MNFNFGNIGSKIGETKKGCFNSIGGIFFGFILFAFAFLPAWCSVKGVREYSEEIAELELFTPEQALDSSGPVKMEGDLDPFTDIEPIYFNPECGSAKGEIEVFWYEWDISEYYEERDSDGDVSTGWRHVDSGKGITDSFTLGDIEINPGNAKTRFRDFETCETGGIREVGEEKLVEKWIPLADIDRLLVVGDIDTGKISGGDPFFISNLPHDQLVEKLASEENLMRWIWTGLSILMFTIAFNLIIGPLLFVMKFVPVIGGGLRFFIFIASLIISAILVFLIKFIIAFWWLLIILMLGLIFLIISIASKQKSAPEPAPAAAPSAPTRPETAPPASTDTCPSCGDPIDPNEKFCDKCGRKVRCPKCGDPISEGEKFCNSCGEKLE